MAATTVFLLEFILRISVWLGSFVLLIKSLDIRISPLPAHLRKIFQLGLAICIMPLFADMFSVGLNCRMLAWCGIIILLFTFAGLKRKSVTPLQWWRFVTIADYVILAIIFAGFLFFIPFSGITHNYTVIKILAAGLWFIFLGCLQTENQVLPPPAVPYTIKQRGKAVLISSGLYGILALSAVFLFGILSNDTSPQNQIFLQLDNILQYLLLCAILIPAVVHIDFHQHFSENWILFFFWTGWMPYANYFLDIIGHNNGTVFTGLFLLSVTVAVVQFKSWKILNKILLLTGLWVSYLLIQFVL